MKLRYVIWIIAFLLGIVTYKLVTKNQLSVPPVIATTNSGVFSEPEIKTIDVLAAFAIDDLLDAIEWVESKGEIKVIGQASEIGPYQITKQYVEDVNRIIMVLSMDIPFFTYENRQDRTASREMVKIYITYYAFGELLPPEILFITIPLAEDMARIHNAGPDGYRNDPRWFVRNREYILEDAVTKINNSLAYWELVKARMNERK